MPTLSRKLGRIYRSPAKLSIAIALLGFIFPILATWLSFQANSEPFAFPALFAMHVHSHLLQIIDMAPLVLGSCAYFVATLSHESAIRLDRLQRYADNRGQNIQQIMETCFDALITTGAGGVIENWNTAAEQLFGYDRHEMIGKPLNLIDPKEMRIGPRSVLSQASREHERCIVDSEFVTKDGRRFSASSSVGVLRSDDGQATGLLAIVRDMSKQRQLEESLIKARDAAESANESKSRFLANMSHEIRTPMNGVIGMTQVLLDTELSGYQKEMLNTLHASAEQLSFVINDILDLSKLEADKLIIEQKPIELIRLIQNTGAMFELPTSSKGIGLTVSISDEVPESVVGDYHRIKQILINLLNNAVKFTDDGQVTLRARIARQIRQNIVLSFEVEDTGVGMSPKQSAQIFAPFTQVDDSSTRAVTGTGLGLSICRFLVEKMGGEIGVISEAGKGSTFWFTIKTTAAELAPKSVDELLSDVEVSVAGTHVLLVDDNIVNQKVAMALLRGMECTVDVAGNGREAVEAINARRYDLVLMDVQMPVLDGFAATRQVRASSPHADVPIVAMTARAMQGDREECLAVGMDDHLPKPINKDLLRRRVALWRSRRSDAAGIAPAESGTLTIDARAHVTGAYDRRILDEPEDGVRTESSAHYERPSTAVVAGPADTAEPAVDAAALGDLLAAMGDTGLDLVREIVEEFLQSVPAECVELCDAAEAGNAERVREIAHKMRSSTGNLGVRPMYRMCSELEECVRAGTHDGLLSRATAISNELDRARGELEAWLAANSTQQSDQSAA